jgi:phosphatidylglycerophosphate synthase
VLPVVLYVPDAASRALAARPLAGRPLIVRTLVAASRTGAPLIGVPAALRDADLERAIGRAPLPAATVRWLRPSSDGDRATFTRRGAVLVPLSVAVDRDTLEGLDAEPCPAGGAVLEASAGTVAPVAAVAGPILAELWDRLAAAQECGSVLARALARTRPERRRVGGLYAPVRAETDLSTAETALWQRIGSEEDSVVDRLLHRRCSRPLTRLLVRTPVTPNQITLASLAVGAVAVWALWEATPITATLGLVMYALATVLDHADGEVARLTFQESRFGARLDWASDTLIHGVAVLAMGVSAGDAGLALGILGGVGVGLAAEFARRLRRRSAPGETMHEVLRSTGNRDAFYLVLLGFVLLRWWLPGLLPALAGLVAAGSHGYWIACWTKLRRLRSARAA